MKCDKCGYMYNGIEHVTNCPKCGNNYGNYDEEGLSNKSKAAVAIGAAAGAAAGLANLAMSQKGSVSASDKYDSEGELIVDSDNSNETVSGEQGGDANSNTDFGSSGSSSSGVYDKNDNVDIDSSGTPTVGTNYGTDDEDSSGNDKDKTSSSKPDSTIPDKGIYGDGTDGEKSDDDSDKDTDDSDKGTDKDGSDKETDKDGSDKGTDKDGSDKGTDEDGSDKGTDKDGSDKGIDEDGSDKGTDEDGSDEGTDGEGSDEGTDGEGSDEGTDGEGSDEGTDGEGSDEGTDGEGSDEGTDGEGSDEGDQDVPTEEEIAAGEAPEPEKPRGGSGWGYGDIGFEPVQLLEALSFFGLGSSGVSLSGTRTLEAVQDGDTDFPSTASGILDRVSSLPGLNYSFDKSSIMSAFNNAMGSGSSGVLNELKADLTRLRDSYQKLVPDFEVIALLQCKSQIELAAQGELPEGSVNWKNVMSGRGMSYEEFVASVYNGLDNYFQDEIERLEDPNLTQAEWQDSFLYRNYEGSVDYDSRLEILQGYQSMVDMLAISLIQIGKPLDDGGIGVDLSREYCSNGESLNDFINKHLNDGLYDPDLELLSEEDRKNYVIDENDESNYKSDSQKMLERYAYMHYTEIPEGERTTDEQNIVNSINEYLATAGEEYYNKYNIAVPVNSHLYSLATIGVQNEAFDADGQYVTAEERTASGNRIVEIFTQPWFTGQTPEERLGRSLFEESFFMSQEFYEDVYPDFTRDQTLFEGLFVTNPDGSRTLAEGACQKYFSNMVRSGEYTYDELCEMFGKENIISAAEVNGGAGYLLNGDVSETVLLNWIADNSGYSLGSVAGIYYDFENGERVLKEGYTIDLVFESCVVNSYLKNTEEYYFMAEQMEIFGQLSAYFPITQSASREQYAQSSGWAKYEEDKAKYDEEKAKYDADPEAYGEPPIEPAVPTEPHPDTQFDVPTYWSNRAQELYLEFLDSKDVTEYLPDVTAFDGMEGIDPDTWQKGEFSWDMKAILGYDPKTGVYSSQAGLEAYNSFTDRAVNYLIGENQTKNYIYSVHSIALSDTLNNIDPLIAQTQSDYWVEQDHYWDLLTQREWIEDPESEEARELDRQIAESEQKLADFEKAEAEMENAKVVLQSNIQDVTAITNQLNIDFENLIPRFSNFKLEDLSVLDIELNDEQLKEKYVEPYYYYDEYGNKYSFGNQLTQETKDQIRTEVIDSIPEEITNGMSDEELNDYINEMVAKREATYIMELKAKGINIDMSSCGDLCRNYVTNFEYTIANESSGEHLKNLYIMEYMHDGLMPTNPPGTFNAVESYNQYVNFFNTTNEMSFNTEAIKRAEAYLNSYAGDLKEQWSEDGEYTFWEAAGVFFVDIGEHLLEDVLIPAGNGLVNSIVGVGRLFENLIEDLSKIGGGPGIEITSNKTLDINAAMWDNIYSRGAQTGQLTQLQTWVMQASQSVGNMAIPMILSACSMGTLGTIWMGASAAGNTLEECKRSGMNLAQSYTYAALSAGTEIVMEKLLGAMPGISLKIPKMGFAGVVGNMFSEAREEVIQTLIDPVLQDIGAMAGIFQDYMTLEPDENGFKPDFKTYCNDILKNESADLGIIEAFMKDGNYLGDLLSQVDGKELLDSAIVAMISSGMTSSVKIVQATSSLLQYGNSSVIEFSKIRASDLQLQGLTAEQANAAVKTELAQLGALSIDFKTKLDSLMNDPNVQAAYEAQKAEYDEAKKNDKKYNNPRAEFELVDYCLELAYNEVILGGTAVNTQSKAVLLNQAQAQIEALNSEIAGLEEDLRVLDESGIKGAEYHSQKADIMASLDAAKSNLAALEAKLPSLEQSYNEAKGQEQDSVTKLDTMYENLLQQVNDLVEQRNKLEANMDQNADNQQKLAEIDAAINDIYENKLPALQAAADTVRSNIQNKIDAETTTKNELTQRNQELMTEMNTADDQRVTDIKAEIKQNNQKIKEIDSKIKALQMGLNPKDVNQLENRLNLLQNSINLNTNPNPEIQNQLELTRNELADTLSRERATLVTKINKINADKSTFREDANTPRLDELVSDYKTRIDKIDTRLTELKADGADVREGSKVEIVTDSAGIIGKKNTLSYVSSSVLGVVGIGTATGGVTTIGNLTTIIDNKISGMHKELNGLQKQEKQNKKNGLKEDPKITKKKQDIKQQIKDHKKVKADLLKSMHEYGMNNNSLLTDFMDALQGDIDTFYGIESGTFVDTTFMEHTTEVKIEGIPTEVSSEIANITNTVNGLMKLINNFNTVDTTDAKTASEFKKAIAEFFEKSRTTIGNIAVKIPKMFDMSSVFENIGKKIETLRNFPTNTRNELLNQYNSLQIKINDIVSQLNSPNPQVDPKLVAEVFSEYESFRTTFTEGLEDIISRNAETVNNISEKVNNTDTDPKVMFNEIFESISQIMENLSSYNESLEVLTDVEMVGQKLSDLFNLTKAEGELESLFSTSSATSEIAKKLNEFKANLVKYAKLAFSDRKSFETVADINGETVTSTTSADIFGSTVGAVRQLLESINDLFNKHFKTTTEKIKISGTIQSISASITEYISGLFTGTTKYSKEKSAELLNSIKELGNNIKTTLTQTQIAIESAKSMLADGNIAGVVELVNTNPKVLKGLLKDGHYEFLADTNISQETLLSAIKQLNSLGKLGEISGFTFNTGTNVDLTFELLSNGLTVNFDDAILNDLYAKVTEQLVNTKKVSGALRTAAITTYANMLSNSIVSGTDLKSATDIIAKAAESHPDIIAALFENCTHFSLSESLNVLSSCNANTVRSILNNLSFNTKAGLFMESLNSITYYMANNITASEGFYETMYDTGLEAIEYIKSVYEDSASLNHFMSYITSNYSKTAGMTELNKILASIASDMGYAKTQLYDVYGQNLYREEVYNGVKVKVFVNNQTSRDIRKTEAFIAQFFRNLNNQSLPEVLRGALTEVNFHDLGNPYDNYWAVTYDPFDIRQGFTSAATGGHGQINSWQYLGGSLDTIAHELGHSLDTLLFQHRNGYHGFVTADPNSAWQRAIAADGKDVTEYGKNSPAEDLAESVMKFVTDRANFEAEFPNRAAALKDLLTEFTEYQYGLTPNCDMKAVSDALVKAGYSQTQVESWVQSGLDVDTLREAAVNKLAFGIDSTTELDIKAQGAKVLDTLNVYISTGNTTGIAELVNQNTSLVIDLINQGQVEFIGSPNLSVEALTQAIGYIQQNGDLSVLSNIKIDIGSDVAKAVPLLKAGLTFNFDSASMNQLYETVVNEIVYNEYSTINQLKTARTFMNAIGLGDVKIKVNDEYLAKRLAYSGYTNLELTPDVAHHYFESIINICVSKGKSPESIKLITDVITAFSNDSGAISTLFGPNIDFATAKILLTGLGNCSIDVIDSVIPNIHIDAVPVVYKEILHSVYMDGDKPRFRDYIAELYYPFEGQSKSEAETKLYLMNYRVFERLFNEVGYDGSNSQIVERIKTYLADNQSMTTQEVYRALASMYFRSELKLFHLNYGLSSGDIIKVNGVDIKLFDRNIDPIKLEQMLNNFMSAFDKLPPVYKNAVEAIGLHTSDTAWNLKDSVDVAGADKWGRVMAYRAGGTKFLDFFHGEIDLSTLAHEIGHIIDADMLELLGYSGTDAFCFTEAYDSWQNAVEADRNVTTNEYNGYVSEYGRRSVEVTHVGFKEDFCDSLGEFFADQETFMEKYPNRAELIINLLYEYTQLKFKTDSITDINGLRDLINKIGADSSIIDKMDGKYSFETIKEAVVEYITFGRDISIGEETMREVISRYNTANNSVPQQTVNYGNLSINEAMDLVNQSLDNIPKLLDAGNYLFLSSPNLSTDALVAAMRHLYMNGRISAVSNMMFNVNDVGAAEYLVRLGVNITVDPSIQVQFVDSIIYNILSDSGSSYGEILNVKNLFDRMGINDFTIFVNDTRLANNLFNAGFTNLTLDPSIIGKPSMTNIVATLAQNAISTGDVTTAVELINANSSIVYNLINAGLYEIVNYPGLDTMNIMNALDQIWINDPSALDRIKIDAGTNVELAKIAAAYGMEFTYDDSIRSEIFNSLKDMLLNNSFISSQDVENIMSAFEKLGYAGEVITVSDVDTMKRLVFNGFTNIEPSFEIISEFCDAMRLQIARSGYDSQLMIDTISRYAHNGDIIYELFNPNALLTAEFTKMSFALAKCTNEVISEVIYSVDSEALVKIYGSLYNNVRRNKANQLYVAGLKSVWDAEYSNNVDDYIAKYKFMAHQVFERVFDEIGYDADNSDIIQGIKNMLANGQSLTAREVYAAMAQSWVIAESDYLRNNVGVSPENVINIGGVQSKLYIDAMNETKILQMLEVYKDTMSKLPAVYRNALTMVGFHSTYAPADVVKYILAGGPSQYGILAFNLGSTRQVEIFRGAVKAHTIVHEIGHIFDSEFTALLNGINSDDIVRNPYSVRSDAWREAVDADYLLGRNHTVEDRYVSYYARWSVERDSEGLKEDFCDSMAEFFTNREAFVAKYPNRASLIIDMLYNFTEMKYSLNDMTTTQELKDLMTKLGDDASVVDRLVDAGYSFTDIKAAVRESITFGGEVNPDARTMDEYTETFDFTSDKIEVDETPTEEMPTITQNVTDELNIQDIDASDIPAVATNLEDVFNILNNKYLNAREILNQYLTTGDISYITRSNGVRDFVSQFTVEEFAELIENSEFANAIKPVSAEEAMRITEPPLIDSNSKPLIKNQNIVSRAAQEILANAVSAFRNAFGLIDIQEAERNGVVFVEHDPSKAKEGAREKNWVFGKVGSFLFKKTLEINYENFGEILGYEFAKLIGLECAKYDLATFNGQNGVISYNILGPNEELISGKEMLEMVDQFYITPVRRIVENYESILSNHQSQTVSDDVVRATLSQFIDLYNSSFVRAEGFTEFVESLNLENMTSKELQKAFNRFTEYYDNVASLYEYNFQDWNNKKKVVVSNNLYDIWTLVDKYCDLFGYKIADGQNIMKDLVKMSVYDIVLGQGDRHISNWSIILDKVTGSIRFAPIYDNSNMCNLNESKTTLAGKVSSILAFEKEKGRMNPSKYQRSLENLIRQLSGSDSKIMVEYSDNQVKNNNIDMLEALIKSSDAETVAMIRDICSQFTKENIDKIFDEFVETYGVEVPSDVRIIVSKSIELKMERINQLFNDDGNSSPSSPIDDSVDIFEIPGDSSESLDIVEAESRHENSDGNTVIEVSDITQELLDIIRSGSERGNITIKVNGNQVLLNGSRINEQFKGVFKHLHEIAYEKVINLEDAVVLFDKTKILDGLKDKIQFNTFVENEISKLLDSIISQIKSKVDNDTISKDELEKLVKDTVFQSSRIFLDTKTRQILMENLLNTLNNSNISTMMNAKTIVKLLDYSGLSLDSQYLELYNMLSNMGDVSISVDNIKVGDVTFTKDDIIQLLKEAKTRMHNVALLNYLQGNYYNMEAVKDGDKVVLGIGHKVLVNASLDPSKPCIYEILARSPEANESVDGDLAVVVYHIQPVKGEITISGDDLITKLAEEQSSRDYVKFDLSGMDVKTAFEFFENYYADVTNQKYKEVLLLEAKTRFVCSKIYSIIEGLTLPKIRKDIQNALRTKKDVNNINPAVYFNNMVEKVFGKQLPNYKKINELLSYINFDSSMSDRIVKLLKEDVKIQFMESTKFNKEDFEQIMKTYNSKLDIKKITSDEYIIRDIATGEFVAYIAPTERYIISKEAKSAIPDDSSLTSVTKNDAILYALKQDLNLSELFTEKEILDFNSRNDRILDNLLYDNVTGRFVRILKDRRIVEFEMDALDKLLGYYELSDQKTILDSLTEAKRANYLSGIEGVRMKEEILSSLDPSLTEIEKARKLYIELAKRVTYDATYSKLQSASIYQHNISFENLTSVNVICKGWAELYFELLLDAGFEPENIKIVSAGDNVGAHRWVTLELENGKILIADAADAILGGNDLSRAKYGGKLFGFVTVNSALADQRLTEMVFDDIEYYKSLVASSIAIDRKIGYLTGQTYLGDAVIKAKKLFKFSFRKTDNALVKVAKKLFEVPIIEGSSGLDVYLYYNALRRYNNLDGRLLDVEYDIRSLGNGKYEYYAIVKSVENNMYMIYTQSLGKIIFNNPNEFEQYRRDNNIY